MVRIKKQKDKKVIHHTIQIERKSKSFLVVNIDNEVRFELAFAESNVTVNYLKIDNVCELDNFEFLSPNTEFFSSRLNEFLLKSVTKEYEEYLIETTEKVWFEKLKEKLKVLSLLLSKKENKSNPYFLHGFPYISDFINNDMKFILFDNFLYVINKGNNLRLFIHGENPKNKEDISHFIRDIEDIDLQEEILSQKNMILYFYTEWDNLFKHEITSLAEDNMMHMLSIS